VTQARRGAAEVGREVWDADLFAAYSPEKNRYIGRDEWIRRVVDAADVFGPSRVIPNFVAGIEMARPYGFSDVEVAIASTQQGLAFFMSHGVVPRLTTWCPEPTTPLGKLNPEGASLEYHLRLLRSIAIPSRNSSFLRLPATAIQDREKLYSPLVHSWMSCRRKLLRTEPNRYKTEDQVQSPTQSPSARVAIDARPVSMIGAEGFEPPTRESFHEIRVPEILCRSIRTDKIPCESCSLLVNPSVHHYRKD
jgi:hypothetical protein